MGFVQRPKPVHPTSLLLFLGVYSSLIAAGHFVGQFKSNDLSATPTFMIIGAAKCGTTDLYVQLTMNSSTELDPDRPDPPLLSHIKEIMLLHKPWSSSKLLLGSALLRSYLRDIHHPCAVHHDQDLDHAEVEIDVDVAGNRDESGASGAATAVAVRACLDSRPRQSTLDASPRYLSSPFTPLQLRAISTDTKVIAMLREPSEALESFYNHRWKGRYQDTPLDKLVDAFFDFADQSSAAAACLTRLVACGAATRCQEEGWRDLSALGLASGVDFVLFANSLYVYGLAAWRRHYFQPGRAMVIDSHAYYRDRLSVMEQVVHFLYGRGMTPTERHLAISAPVPNARPREVPFGDSSSSSSQDGPGKPPWLLTPDRRERVQSFFAVHVLGRLPGLLSELRDGGAWVVGFDSAPWPWVAQ